MKSLFFIEKAHALAKRAATDNTERLQMPCGSIFQDRASSKLLTLLTMNEIELLLLGKRKEWEQDRRRASFLLLLEK